MHLDYHHHQMLLENNILQLLIYFLLLGKIEPAPTEPCAEIPEETLIVLLGQAYNSRYMSIKPPPTDDDNATTEGTEYFVKRGFFEAPFFAKEEVSNAELPAWETDHQRFFEKKEREAKERAEKERKAKKALPKKKNETNSNNDSKAKSARAVIIHRLLPEKKNQTAKEDENPPEKVNIFVQRPWECKVYINWIDLGYEYFPRYLRSVECSKPSCWYGHYDCKPRAFTMKVLRRKRNKCVKVTDKLIMMISQPIKEEYTELWIWEEKKINFCCDCALPYKKF